VAGLAGQRAILANRLVSWPAQPLRGVELSSRLLLERAEIEHLTYPSELAAPALQRLAEVETPELDGLEAAPWLRIELAKERELWRMGVEQFQREHTELLVLYTHLIDSAHHRYLKYHWPDRYRFQPAAEGREAFGEAVAATYQEVDRMIAEVLVAVGPDVRVLVVSDHGVRPNLALTEDLPEPQGETSMPPAPLDEVSGVHGDAPDGVFCLAGPGVRPGVLGEAPHILDLAPLILRLLELPVAEDLERPDPGPLLAALLGEERAIPAVETFEGLIPRRIRTRASVADESILEELRALGYIE
jgi:predicted AlkP superfamily phosphohydrolase/phosphomutase